MGEYAIRRTDGQKIKIGVCEDMFYLRIEDADKVDPISGNVDATVQPGLRFRLPYPDEDGFGVGEAEDYTRCLRLYRTVKDGRHEWTDDYSPDFAATDTRPAFMQLRHEESGLTVSVPCHHGTRLPDVGLKASARWSGKAHSIVLYAVKRETGGEVVPIIRCRHCGLLWRDAWENVLPYVPGAELRARLAKHAEVKP